MDERRYLTFKKPATGEVFGQVAMATPEEAKQAIVELRARQPEWAAKPVRERVRILGEFQKLLIEAADEISLLITQDTGKARQDALIELFMTVDVLANLRRRARRWLRRERISSGLFFFKRCYIEHAPFGVALVISPWNYPFYLAMPPVLGALLAGNTVALKPSEVSPATGALMESLFLRVPELAPYVRVIHGDGAVGNALVCAPPDYVYLTGSTKTGRIVAQNAAANFIPVACELGGKDATIVLEDADIEAAARWTVWGAFYNTGQTCMGVERVYVVESVYDEFMRHVIAYTRQIKVGYSEDLYSHYHIGPMTDPRQSRIVGEHLQDAITKGAQVLIEGKQEGMYIHPYVLAEVDHSMSAMWDETFGPVLPVMKVKDEAEAIRLANDSPFGLGASVWSRNIAHAEQVARKVQAGAILINDTVVQIAIPMLPFGGVKQSGNARTHGKEGLMQFTQIRSYAVSGTPNPLDLAVALRQPGRYDLEFNMLHLVFGTSLAQRLKPFLHPRKK